MRPSETDDDGRVVVIILLQHDLQFRHRRPPDVRRIQFAQVGHQQIYRRLLIFKHLKADLVPRLKLMLVIQDIAAGRMNWIGGFVWVIGVGLDDLCLRHHVGITNHQNYP